MGSEFGLFSKQKTQFLVFSLSLHQQMDTLLQLVFKANQVDNYNVFSGLEDIKHILRNHRFNLNNIYSRLNHVEICLLSYFASSELNNSPGDPTDPIESSSLGCTIVSSIPK